MDPSSVHSSTRDDVGRWYRRTDDPSINGRNGSSRGHPSFSVRRSLARWRLQSALHYCVSVHSLRARKLNESSDRLTHARTHASLPAVRRSSRRPSRRAIDRSLTCIYRSRRAYASVRIHRCSERAMTDRPRDRPNGTPAPFRPLVHPSCRSLSRYVRKYQ